MAERTQIYLNDGATTALIDICERRGLVAERGKTAGQPSLSALLNAIADGEFILIGNDEYIKIAQNVRDLSQEKQAADIDHQAAVMRLERQLTAANELAQQRTNELVILFRTADKLLDHWLIGRLINWLLPDCKFYIQTMEMKQ